MTSASDLDRLYEIMGQDAQLWLQQAKKLKLSADMFRVPLMEALEAHEYSESTRIKQLAYMDAFMMLTGLAFENLIKGIDIAQNPERVANRELDTKGWLRGGHDLLDYARKAKLTSEQTHLLRRLEEYVVWAGAYMIPKKADTYIKSTMPENLKSLYSTDYDTIDKLFDHLSEVLVSEWRKKGALKW